MAGEGGAHPFSSTHSPPPHPAVPLHLRPRPLTPPLFYVHFDFLPSLSPELWREVFHHGRHKTFQSEVRVCSHIFFYYVLFPQSFIPNLTNASSSYRVLFSIYYKVGHFLGKRIMK